MDVPVVLFFFIKDLSTFSTVRSGSSIKGLFNFSIRMSTEVWFLKVPVKCPRVSSTVVFHLIKKVIEPSS